MELECGKLSKTQKFSAMCGGGRERKSNILGKTNRWGGAHAESATIDCFMLCCCEKVPLGLEILD